MEKVLEILESTASLSLEQYCDLAVGTEKVAPSWLPMGLVPAYRLNHAVLGLNSEVHEYNAALRDFYGLQENRPKAAINLAEEIGDFWWYTALAWKAIGSKPVVLEAGYYVRDWSLSILSDEAKRGFIYQKPIDMDKVCKALGSIGTWLMSNGPVGMGPGISPEEAASRIWKANLAKLYKRHGKAYADLSGLEYNRDREQEALVLKQHLSGAD